MHDDVIHDRTTIGSSIMNDVIVTELHIDVIQRFLTLPCGQEGLAKRLIMTETKPITCLIAVDSCKVALTTILTLTYWFPTGYRTWR